MINLSILGEYGWQERRSKSPAFMTEGSLTSLCLIFMHDQAPKRKNNSGGEKDGTRKITRLRIEIWLTSFEKLRFVFSWHSECISSPSLYNKQTHQWFSIQAAVKRKKLNWNKKQNKKHKTLFHSTLSHSVSCFSTIFHASPRKESSIISI